MSSEALKLDAGRAVPIDWSAWVAVDDAAQALGLHRDSLSRRCRDQLEAMGLAMRLRSSHGGPAGWWVSRRYDPRLAHGRLEQFAAEAPDLGRFSEAQRQSAWARWEIVVRFRQAKRERRGAVLSWLPAFAAEVLAAVVAPVEAKYGVRLKVSPRSIRRWDADCPTIADIDKLIDKRGGDARSQGDEAFWSKFKSLYLTDDAREAKECWRRTKQWAQANGQDYCSYRSLLNQLDRRIPPAAQLSYRDPKAYRDMVEPTAELHPETFATNERWESDERICDVRVRLPDGTIGRPVFTAWMDWRTRRIMGYVVEAFGDSTTISAALYHALTSDGSIGGPPRIAWTDNGKDYLSVGGRTRRKIEDADVPRFRGLYAMLGIDLHLANPKGPRGKGRIERFFQTKGDKLDAFLPGYCGNAPENRPESLAELENRPEKLLSLAEYRERVAAWIIEYNASADQRQTGPRGGWRTAEPR